MGGVGDLSMERVLRPSMGRGQSHRAAAAVRREERRVYTVEDERHSTLRQALLHFPHRLSKSTFLISKK